MLRAIGAHAAPGRNLYVVGGYVRDMLLGGYTWDLDLVYEGDAPALAHEFAEKYGGEVVAYPPFGTATWHLDEEATFAYTHGFDVLPLPGFIDFATTRTEAYLEPAMLPTVIPMPDPDTLFLDVARRDFTINTLALQIAPLAEFGKVIDYVGGMTDLRSGIVRALHPNSFNDDPTRIFRAARYEQRYNFRIDAATEALVEPALPYIDKLSGERLRHEIDIVLQEAAPEKPLNRLEAWGALRSAVLTFDDWTDSKFRLAPGLMKGWISEKRVGDLQIIYWILLTCRAPKDYGRLIARLPFARSLADMIDQAQRLYMVLGELAGITKRSQAARLIESVSKNLPEVVLCAVLIAAVFSYPTTNLYGYAQMWRHAKPVLTGDDLLQMGLQRGPLIGKLLARLRDAHIDGVFPILNAEAERTLVQTWIQIDDL